MESSVPSSRHSVGIIYRSPNHFIVVSHGVEQHMRTENWQIILKTRIAAQKKSMAPNIRVSKEECDCSIRQLNQICRRTLFVHINYFDLSFASSSNRMRFPKLLRTGSAAATVWRAFRLRVCPFRAAGALEYLIKSQTQIIAFVKSIKRSIVPASIERRRGGRVRRVASAD